MDGRISIRCIGLKHQNHQENFSLLIPKDFFHRYCLFGMVNV
jgi:hypothetical protein